MDIDTILVAGTSSHGVTEAIMDTGCTKCCAGMEWTTAYLESLSTMDRASVVIKQGTNKFRFGNDKVFHSKGFIIAPVYLGGRRKLLGFDRVEAKIPLLISLKVMRKVGMDLIFRQDSCTAKIEDTEVKMEMRGGHIWINIAPPQLESEVMYSVGKPGKPLTKTEVFKLHEQLAHKPKDVMIKIIKASDRWSEETQQLVDQSYEECASKTCRARLQCQKIRKVGARLPQRLGECVAMDLKISSGTDKNILYIIDLFSNFVVADVITSKRPAHIAEKLLECWYGRGLPNIKTLLTDNGLEFVGTEMKELISYMNIKHICTVPRTPQMNGQCERIHSLVDSNSARLREARPSLTQKQALSWACHAWNQEEKRHGYSPADLVYGPASRDTSFVDLAPNQLQVPDMSTNILDQLFARERARVEHLKLRADNKIREALYRQTIPTRDNKPLGTWVWLKRSLENDWKGPGQIAHSLDSGCSVRIGNVYYNARHEDCLPLNEREKELEGLLDGQGPESEQREFLDAVEYEQPELRVRVSRNHQSTENDSPRDSTDDTNDNVVQDNVQCAEQSEGLQQAPTGQTDEEIIPVTTESQSQPGMTRNIPGRRKKASVAKKNKPYDSPLGLERKQTIYVNRIGQGWTPVTVEDRYYPANNTGEWYRLRFQPGNYRSDGMVDLTVSDWRTDNPERPEVSQVSFNETYNLVPAAEKDADVEVVIEHDSENVDVNLAKGETNNVWLVQIPIKDHGQDRVLRAKQKELETLKQFETFTEVDERSLTTRQKEKILPATWSVVLKDVNDDESVKARLCARGDLEPGAPRSDSPTVSRQSLRLLLSSAASKGEKIYSLDFKGAFVQGQQIEREVYLLPPADVRRERPHLLWRVNKRLYGFKDASRGWYLEFDRAMKELGCVASTVDAAMYIYKDDKGKVAGLAGVHVDDVLYSGTKEFHDKVIGVLKKNYIIGRVEEELFTFTGWSLKQDAQGIVLTQDHYLGQIDQDKFAIIEKIHGSDSEQLNQEFQQLFRSLVGALQWIVSISRPDKAYYTVSLAARLGKANLGDLRSGWKQLSAMIKDPISIKFNALQDFDSCQLQIFCDSSWAKMDGCETVVANVSFLVDKAGNSTVLDWAAHKLDIPEGSPLSAESRAALEAYEKVPWLRSLVSEMFGVGQVPAHIITDSKSLRDAINTTTVVKDKKAMVTICTLRRVPEVENIKISWWRGARQLSDVMTKPGVNNTKMVTVLSQGRLDVLNK